MLSILILSDIFLSGIIRGTITLSGIVLRASLWCSFLTVLMPNAKLSFIMMSGIMLSVFVLSLITLSVIILNVIKLSVLMLSDQMLGVMMWGFAERHCAEC
jgi:hypothetical protein